MVPFPSLCQLTHSHNFRILSITPIHAGSAGWFSKLLGRGDSESKATVADVGEEMQAYYDEKLKRWIFPGDDPAEVAKPLAPPPIIPKSSDTTTLIPVTPARSNNDPLAALMAPPPSRGIPSKRGGGLPGVPMTAMASTNSTGGGGGGDVKKTGPPISPMNQTPTYAVFQPKPASADLTT